jgi:excisionase family DNA binding protein
MEKTSAEWLSRDEVAQRLDVHRRTVSRLLDSGQLVGYKVGGQWRVAKADLQAYLRRVRNIPAEESGITAGEVRRVLGLLDDERVRLLLSEFGVTAAGARDIRDAKALFRRVLLEALNGSE